MTHGEWIRYNRNFLAALGPLYADLERARGFIENIKLIESIPFARILWYVGEDMPIWVRISSLESLESCSQQFQQQEAA